MAAGASAEVSRRIRHKRDPFRYDTARLGSVPQQQ